MVILTLSAINGLSSPWGCLLGNLQERGMRAGTESVLLLSGFGKAADMLVSDGEALFEHQREMRAYLRACLEQTLPAVRPCAGMTSYHPRCPRPAKAGR